METIKTSDIKRELGGGGSDPVNSVAKAVEGINYVPVPRPGTWEQTADALNLWGVYVQQWGRRAGQDVKALDVKTGLKSGYHMDPPPEAPFTLSAADKLALQPPS